MANIKSQKKRILTNEKARLRNNAVKSELKTAIRAVNTAVESADKDAAGTALVAASRKLDKAVSKGVIHKNNAANRTSAISNKVNALYGFSSGTALIKRPAPPGCRPLGLTPGIFPASFSDDWPTWRSQ